MQDKMYTNLVLKNYVTIGIILVEGTAGTQSSKANQKR